MLTICSLTLGRPPAAHAQRLNNFDFTGLNEQIDNYLQVQKYVPGSTRQGAVYVADLASGETLTVNPGVLFSGVSMTKIAVLVSLYHDFPPPLDHDASVLVAKMMLCSDNAATNALLKLIGKGKTEAGVKIVSALMHSFGFETFLLGRAYSDNGAPDFTSGPVDPHSADADPINRITPEELGRLMTRIYHCAQNEDENNSSGFAGQPSTEACRHMVRVMRANHIGALIEAGVPERIAVAHKQGWSQDTHGDVAFISTPGGDYVLVIALHQRKWLDYKGSFPVMSEVSRIVYNAFNPTDKLAAIHPQPIPKECPLDPDVIADLQQPDAPPL